jgi:alpha/beta superfamily hydrolase
MGKNFKKLSQSDKTKLFIQGDRDDIAVYNNFKNHYSFYHDPKTFEIIKGADHFYWGYENKLATLVISFYNTQKSN